MTCPCDRLPRPGLRPIPAGLATIPRQIGGFPEFRRSMLAAVRSHAALAGWRPSGDRDLGLMLLEMWAYTSDVLAFYDEVIAHEAYLRTARRRPSLRRLIELLGYLPRPGVGATATLAVLAEGRKPVVLSEGTGFRSGAFDGQPPQVFELGGDHTVHPLTNRWDIEAPVSSTLGDPGAGTLSLTELFLEPTTATAAAGDRLIVRAGSLTRATTVTGVEDIEGPDGRPLVRLSPSPSVSLAASTPLADVELWVATQTAGLWTLQLTGSTNPAAIDTPTGSTKGRISLDGVHRQIRAGQDLILSKGQELRWFKVDQVTEQPFQINTGGEFTVSGTKVTTTPATVPATRVVLDVSINDAARKASSAANWTSTDASALTVHHRFVEAGTVTAPAKTTLDETDPLVLTAPFEEPSNGHRPTRFLLQDRDERSLEVGGELDFDDREIDLGQAESWDPALVLPVQAYGNLITASRGETVIGEVLGSGDASVPNQSFALQKKPLTYLPSPTAGNAWQAESTLAVWVNGVRWSERMSFHGASGEDRIYIVRQNDAGESVVIFGNGHRGSRLPTGRDNVVANYRFGAESAVPPAGSITQLAHPVTGVTAVLNPMPASGGADPEGPDRLRTSAPSSALILGRAVSMRDMESVAAGSAGVRAVKGEWRWHGTRQRPVAVIWYVGQAGVEDDVTQALHGVTDPTTPIEVELAQGLPTTLALDIDIDPAYLERNVLAAVRAALMDAETGILAPERIGIGTPLYRSRIFEAVLAIPGTVSVRGVTLDGQPFSDFAVSPGAGAYFDLESGSLELNGEEGSGA